MAHPQAWGRGQTPIDTIDPASRHLAGTLWWAARRRGTAARLTYTRAACHGLTDRDESRAQRLTPLPGHPDLVLARAVHRGVVSRDDAELVSSTRLSKETLEKAAHRMGLSYQASRQRRRRAEMRLLRFLGRPADTREFALAAA